MKQSSMSALRTILESTKENPRKHEYDEYLINHITGVQRAWNEILKPYLIQNLSKYHLTEDDIRRTDSEVMQHDQSKYDVEEYGAYCDYFYPTNEHKADPVAFDYAWLRHQKINPHHWQYWVIIRDSGEIVPMEMSKPAMLEMLCDWHSFSLKDPKSTAFVWWNNNKHNMVMHENTKTFVNSVIELCKEPLV